MALDARTQFIGHRHVKIKHHIFPCLSVLWVEFHHYFLFLCYRWQLNEIVVQEVAVILQVSKVRRLRRNKKRRRKRRTEGLVCSVQMCECVWVAAIMGHKDTKQLHFLRLYWRFRMVIEQMFSGKSSLFFMIDFKRCLQVSYCSENKISSSVQAVIYHEKIAFII